MHTSELQCAPYSHRSAHNRECTQASLSAAPSYNYCLSRAACSQRSSSVRSDRHRAARARLLDTNTDRISVATRTSSRCSCRMTTSARRLRVDLEHHAPTIKRFWPIVMEASSPPHRLHLVLILVGHTGLCRQKCTFSRGQAHRMSASFVRRHAAGACACLGRVRCARAWAAAPWEVHLGAHR